VQEVMAEREADIGFYYSTRMNWGASLARLKTVADTYPLYSKSDLVWLDIGDAYAGEARSVQNAPNLPGAIRERLRSVYQERAAAAYSKIITRYPMAAHVEDARDRLIQMNRPIPEPTEAMVKQNEAEEQSRQAIRFTDKTWGIIKHGPQVVEASHVGEPTMDAPKRTNAPEITKENVALFNAAVNGPNKGGDATVKPTGINEPPRSDQPSTAPLQFEDVQGSGSSVGVTIVNAPSSTGGTTGTTPAVTPAADPNAVIKPVGPDHTVAPVAEKPLEAPTQVNEVKPTANPVNVDDSKKKKAPKADLSDESSSKKKKKKGLAKLNPF
jgi:outer membrane protein assembly factor BamD